MYAITPSSGRVTFGSALMAADLDTQGAFHCCGVRVDALTLDQAVHRIQELTVAGDGRAVHLCNAYTLSLAIGDPSFTAVINRGDLNLPDGTPLIWIGRRAGFTHMRQRVYGPDHMVATSRAGRVLGLRHYLYGSTPQVMNTLPLRLAELAPGIEIIGAESPPFRPLTENEEVELVERIQLARPDVVWVGLGTPLQDMFVDRFCDRLGTTLIGVGAAFDFIAGAKRQAPTWMQEHGLEWAFRLATEPRRLWRRYLFGNARFLFATRRQLLGFRG
jgi:N-acetylglucosaminyldiphosphoundecaprenol N-acetyl-beta-D-mannosaminyltransferase